MSDPYVGEIRMFAGNYEPAGWLFCSGALLAIAEYETLFVLIGTTYGGDGETTFAVPDMRGRIPLHTGNGFMQGQSGGAEQVTVSSNQMPAHRHAIAASTDSASAAFSNANGVPAHTGASKVYGPAGTPAAMKSGQILATGNDQPHANMAPYLSLNFIIAYYGIFPSST